MKSVEVRRRLRVIAVVAIAAFWAFSGYVYRVSSPADCPREWNGAPVSALCYDDGSCACTYEAGASNEDDPGWRYVPYGRR